MRKMGFFILLTLLIASCSTGKQMVPRDFIETLESTDLSEEQALGIRIGDTEQSLIEKLGEPDEGIGQPVAGARVYEKAQYVITDKNVTSLGLKADTKTARNVQLGDSSETVKEKYGDQFYNRKQNDFNFMGYIDKERQWVIEFFMERDSVLGIIVSELSFFDSAKDAG